MDVRRIGAVIGMFGLLAAACGGGGGGGGGDEKSDQERVQDAIDEALRDSTASSGDLEVPEAELEKVDGAKLRIANLYAADGEGRAIDVYWGFDADTGKKFATLEYGEVSEYVVPETNATLASESDSDGSDVTVSYYLEGETEFETQIMTEDEAMGDGDQLTFALGWSEGGTGGTSQVIFEAGGDSPVPDPPGGKALLALVALGVDGVEGGDFVTFDPGNDCTPGEDVDILGNVAEVLAIDPGSLEVRAYDANTECATGTEPATVDAEAGDRILVLAYGTDKDDRALAVAPME